MPSEVRSPVVLVVDDHQDSLSMYAMGLQALGCRPVTARNADDGFARACDSHPDVIVTDVNLPGTSGLELTRRLRSDARTKHLGIIVLSGHSAGSISREAHDAGCDRILVKPCLPDALAVEVREVLARIGTSGGSQS